MSGILSGSYLAELFGAVLGGVYEDATLEVWARSETRDMLDGTFPYSVVSSTPVRVQRDTCTQRQMSDAGYSRGDVRFMVLQAGLPNEMDHDCRIVYRGVSYQVQPPVEQDPARVYWDVRARPLVGGPF